MFVTHTDGRPRHPAMATFSRVSTSEGRDVEPSQNTSERLDEARAWVEAAWDGLARRLEGGLIDEGALFAVDCVRLVGGLELAGAEPTSGAPAGSAELTPQACLDRAAAALERIPPEERPVSLLTAWAELRALMLRISELPAAASSR